MTLAQTPEEKNNLFPTLCKQDPDAFWSLFQQVADLINSESAPYGAFDETQYRALIAAAFSEAGC